MSFETAIAHAKHTPKSVASILTGKYPAEHRVNYESNTLDEPIPTVTEAFRAEGYETVCVSNNGWVSSETGLDRGFEDCTLLPKSPKDIIQLFGIRETAKFLVNIRKHSAGFQRDMGRHSGAYLMSKIVSDKLDALTDRSDPFFLYVHFNEPHRAYYPPLSWFDTYADQFEMSTHHAGEFSMDVHHNLTERVAEGCPFTDDQWKALKTLYDTEIRYTDMFIGELFQQIQNQFDDTVVIVSSDHGEHFGERGALAHRYVLDDALLRVPLVVTGLDVESTAAPVQHSDVMRTVLEMAGADAEFVDGLDLRKETREFAVSQDNESAQDGLLERNPDFDLDRFFPNVDDTLPERTALRTKTHRYVRGADGTEVLFEIPHEAEGDDIADTRPDLRRNLGARLDSWFENHRSARLGQNNTTNGDLTGEAKDRLKQMGYLEKDF